VLNRIVECRELLRVYDPVDLSKGTEVRNDASTLGSYLFIYCDILLFILTEFRCFYLLYLYSSIVSNTIPIWFVTRHKNVELCKTGRTILNATYVFRVHIINYILLSVLGKRGI